MSDHADLAGSPLLVGLTDDELAALLGIGQERRYAAGDIVVREGTPSDCLFLLRAGAVHVERHADGRRVVLATFDEPGDFFGEMSLIDILPRSADIRAVGGDARVLALPKQALTTVFTRSPRVQMTLILNISRTLSLRLRQAGARIVQLSGSRP